MTKNEIIGVFNEYLSERGSANAIRGMMANAYKQTILDLTAFLDTAQRKKKEAVPMSERMWCIMHDINCEEDIPKCKVCGHNASFAKVYDHGYGNTCCLKCSGIYNTTMDQSHRDRLYSKKAKDNYKKTCMEKYGTDNAFKVESIQDKQKQSVREKYGVDNVSKLDDIKQKKINTCNERYGANYHWQTEEGKLRQKQGVYDKYGVKNVSQLDWVHDKKIATSLDNWGVENPSQSIEIRKKILEQNGVEYITPSGKKALVDSDYESSMIDILISRYGENNVDIQPTRSLKYNLNGKLHYWFPDVIINKNIAVEIKTYSILRVERLLWDQLNIIDPDIESWLIIVNDANYLYLKHLPNRNEWECLTTENLTEIERSYLEKWNFIVL